MIKPVVKDAIITYHDVALDETLLSFNLRKKLEKWGRIDKEAEGYSDQAE
jgi:predicted homoserine dehydrogenase-like protein